jgi:hypothetical protein
MAMNKAEQKMLKGARIDAALRWPTFDEPVPITREEAKTMESASLGSAWTRRVIPAFFINAYNGTIHKGWLDQDGHHHCRQDPELTGRGSVSRDWGAGYRTFGEAYRALRWRMCRDMAEKLYALDEREHTETLSH